MSDHSRFELYQSEVDGDSFDTRRSMPVAVMLMLFTGPLGFGDFYLGFKSKGYTRLLVTLVSVALMLYIGYALVDAAEDVAEFGYRSGQLGRLRFLQEVVNYPRYFLIANSIWSVFSTLNVAMRKGIYETDADGQRLVL
ncbi:hypothetical protein ABYF34_02890 [Buchananella felis]|uniref:hypothetical protein n=1 Tax=Buchananella felis TaxID=3231492 RepID=UPI0035273306